MVSYEELEAAKAAKAAINLILATARKSEVLPTLKPAYRAAVVNFAGKGPLNEARANVGIALSILMHSMPTEEKVDKAKSAIDTWIRELERRL
jgi:hypothetical protein